MSYGKNKLVRHTFHEKTSLAHLSALVCKSALCSNNDRERYGFIGALLFRVWSLAAQMLSSTFLHVACE